MAFRSPMVHRWALRVSVAVVLLAIGVEPLARQVYQLKVLPVEEEMQAAGVYPSRSAPTPGSVADFIRLGELALLPRAGRKAVLCQQSRSHTYLLRIAGHPVELQYVRLKRRLPTFRSDMPTPDATPGPWRRAADLLERHPLLEPSHELARQATRIGEPEFSAFTPLRNLARLSSKIQWVVAAQRSERSRSRYEIRQSTRAGADGFGFVELWSNTELAFVMASFTRSGEELRFEAASRPGDGDARAIVNRMFDTVRLADGAAGPAPSCTEPGSRSS